MILENTKKDLSGYSIENLPWPLIFLLFYNLVAIVIVLVISFTERTDILSTITGTLFLA